MSDRAVIFASTERIEHKAFDLDRGEVVAKSFVPYDEAKAMGIEVVAMPRNLVLWENKKEGKAKDGKKVKPDVKYLHDLGSFVVAVVDEDGKILNEFVGRNFRRPVPIDMATLRALARVFNIGKVAGVKDAA
jgi:hypothetical protein